MGGSRLIGVGGWPMLGLTLGFQGLAVYAPMSTLHSMGHRFAYSIRTHGWTGEVIMVLVLVGIPTLAVWLAFFKARSRDTVAKAWLTYALNVIPICLAIGFALVCTVVLGIR